MPTHHINIKSLAQDLNDAFPEILFAFLFGSSQKGIIIPGSDIDLAFYFEKTASKINLIPRIIDLIESASPGITCDITILNTAGPIVAFEESMDIYTDC